MPLNRFCKTPAPRLLLALHQQHQIHAQRPPRQQIRRRARNRHDRALVVRRPAPVQVPVAARERKRVRRPTCGARGDHVVVPVEEDARALCGRARAVEGREHERVRRLARRELYAWVSVARSSGDGRKGRTREASAPSCVKHFRSQIAACRQSSLCTGELLTLGIPTNFVSAYTRISVGA